MHYTSTMLLFKIILLIQLRHRRNVTVLAFLSPMPSRPSPQPRKPVCMRALSFTVILQVHMMLIYRGSHLPLKV
jgi:hypothetical protein